MSKTVNLKWDYVAPADGAPLDHYVVESRQVTTPESPFTTLNDAVPGTALTFAVEQVVAGKWEFRVHPIDQYGQAPVEPWSSVVVVAADAPNNVSNLVGTVA